MLHWKQLTNLTDDELATYDIAEVNLACTANLPDAPGPLTVMECLHKIDEWAKFVRHYTDRAYEQFFCTNPAKYNHSKALFRSISMVTALQRHCGLRYNPAKIPVDVPFDTADSFIHGAILGAGGTCATIPVILAAVGRRLGYPIKIVDTKGGQYAHLFARWDDPNGERMNLEATNQGLSTPDDDYYRTGMYEIDPEIERKGQFLKSMTPRQELASFLVERACHCRDLRQWSFAVEAFGTASGLVPENAFYLNMLKMAMNAWYEELEKLKPPHFPEVFFQTPGRAFPSALPLELEHKILGRKLTEDVLRDPTLDRKYWEPMRRGERPPIIPLRVHGCLGPKGFDIKIYSKPFADFGGRPFEIIA